MKIEFLNKEIEDDMDDFDELVFIVLAAFVGFIIGVVTGPWVIL